MTTEKRNEIVKPDRKAIAWQKKNRWFGKDEEFTTLALGLHEVLIIAGINPTSTKYYKLIDYYMDGVKKLRAKLKRDKRKKELT